MLVLAAVPEVQLHKLRRAADGAAGGRTRPRRPAHVRALVPTARAAVAAPLPRRRPRAARASAAPGSGVHRGRCGATARLRPDQDAAAARPRLPRAHAGRDARRARCRRGVATRGARLRAPARPGVSVLTFPVSPFPFPVCCTDATMAHKRLTLPATRLSRGRHYSCWAGSWTATCGGSSRSRGCAMTAATPAGSGRCSSREELPHVGRGRGGVGERPETERLAGEPQQALVLVHSDPS